jgi:hypothetical protein
MSNRIESDTILSPDELARFSARGWVRLRSAFPPAAAARMHEFMWEQLRLRHGADPNDPTTWHWSSNGLNRNASNPVYRDVGSPRMRGAITQLLGHSPWKMPDHWGGFLVNAPHGGDAAWRIPTDGWHWDQQPGASLFVFTLYAPLGPREGGTLIVDGSHHLIRRFYSSGTVVGKRKKALTREFNRSHPWLGRLTGVAPCSSDRVAEFTADTVDADGITLRVSEVTGDAGDAILCDGCIYHVAPPRVGPRPRFLCVKSIS